MPDVLLFSLVLTQRQRCRYERLDGDEEMGEIRN